jgi:hypothetical protein
MDSVYADLLDALSPVSKAGLDPDAAAADRAGTMRTLMGDDASPTKGWWEQGEMAQNNVPPRPGAETSPNGSPLPAGLHSRQPAQDDAPDAMPTDAPTVPAPAPAPAVPAGVTPSGTASKPDLAGANAASIALMQSDLAKASQDVDNEAKQPDEASVLAPLEQQRVNAANRQVELQNPYDKDGKLLPEYKPTLGQRLIRGVEGFARGGVFGAVDPTIGGAKAYGAPNKELDIDQTQAAGRVAGADQQLTNARDAWKAQSDRLKAIAAERRALAPAGKDATDASIKQQQVPQDQQKLDQEGTPKNEMEAIAAYGRETDPTKKAALWDTVQKMHQATMQEKPPRAPGEQPTEGMVRYTDLRAAAVRENGGKPLSTDQLAKLSTDLSMRQTPQGAIPQPQADRIKTRKDQAMAKAQQNLSADGKGEYGQDEFVRDMNQAQQNFETSIEDAGGTVEHMEMQPDMQWKQDGTPPANVAAPPPAKSATPAPPKGNGKPLADKGIAAQYLALAGGDKAKARKLAAADGWKF